MAEANSSSSSPSSLDSAPSEITEVTRHPGASAKGKWLIVIVGAAVIGGLGGFLLPPRVNKQVAPIRPLPVAPEPAKPLVEPTDPAESLKPASSHIRITLLHADGSLFLDDRVVPGNAIKMDMPKSKALHVVQARAPGYLPFRRTISFANDIDLAIRLARPPEPNDERSPVPQTSALPPREEPKPSSASAPADDFGMNLQRPAARRPARKMDEADPYVP